MTERNSQDIDIEHQQMHELLPRFIEVERRDGNADEIYPDVAAHIARCDLCQFTVSVVMADLPGFDAPPDSRLRAADLPFIRRPGGSTHTIRPGSRRENYSIHISFPLLLESETDDEVARSRSHTELEVPVSGLSLGSYSLELEEAELGVTLTVYRDMGAAGEGPYYVIADLVGDIAPGAHGAMLMVGTQIYTARVIDQTIEFLNIDLGDVPDQVVLVLES